MLAEEIESFASSSKRSARTRTLASQHRSRPISDSLANAYFRQKVSKELDSGQSKKVDSGNSKKLDSGHRSHHIIACDDEGGWSLGGEMSGGSPGFVNEIVEMLLLLKKVGYLLGVFGIDRIHSQKIN